MDDVCKKIISGIVRRSENPKNNFQRRMLLDFISDNIQSRPAYKDVTTEEISAEIERCLDDAHKV
jgi:hypothetical protein